MSEPTKENPVRTDGCDVLDSRESPELIATATTPELAEKIATALNRLYAQAHALAQAAYLMGKP